jgi:hypothetical protein
MGCIYLYARRVEAFLPRHHSPPTTHDVHTHTWIYTHMDTHTHMATHTHTRTHKSTHTHTLSMEPVPRRVLPPTEPDSALVGGG